MNRRALLVTFVAALGVGVPHVASPEDGPWVGTYAMELPAEVAQQMKDAGAEPFRLEVTLHADGSYTSEGTENGQELAGKGTYAVEGTRITLTETERNGKPLAGENEPIVVEGRDGFSTMMGDTNGIPIKFVRK